MGASLDIREHQGMSASQPLGVRVGDRVEWRNHPDFPEHPVVHRAYDPPEWWARACSGLDYQGHRTRARVEGDGIMVQHGENPEAVRWFSTDELNRVGRPLFLDPVMAWCEEIDGIMA